MYSCSSSNRERTHTHTKVFSRERERADEGVLNLFHIFFSSSIALKGRRGASKESLFRALCLDRIYRRETHTLRDHRHALLAEEGFVVYLEIPRDDEQEEPYVLSRRRRQTTKK